jgi:hypothetical protein
MAAALTHSLLPTAVPPAPHADGRVCCRLLTLHAVTRLTEAALRAHRGDGALGAVTLRARRATPRAQLGDAKSFLGDVQVAAVLARRWRRLVSRWRRRRRGWRRTALSPPYDRWR